MTKSGDKPSAKRLAKLLKKYDTPVAILLVVLVAIAFMWLSHLGRVPPGQGITENACIEKGGHLEYDFPGPNKCVLGR